MSSDITAQARYQSLHRLIGERLRSPAAIPELGAAPGDQNCALADAGFSPTALDIGIASDGWADDTEGRMLRLLDEHGVRYIEWDLEQVRHLLEDESFDGVVLTEVFEHLRNYPLMSLHERGRIPKPLARSRGTLGLLIVMVARSRRSPVGSGRSRTRTRVVGTCKASHAVS